MAIVQRSGAFETSRVIRKRVFGFGDAASDAWTSSAAGAAALSAAQAAAAKLPAGFTMGDPTSDQWGASYYNGVKVIGSGPTYKGDGTTVFYLADNSEAPWSQATMDAIQAAANAAYGVYSYIAEIRTASPAMAAVLMDPEWIALQGGPPIDYNSLSAELQDKIKAVPNLYNTLIGNFAAVTPAPAPVAPSGPQRYVVGGIEFLDNGTVISVNGTPVSGQTLTQAQMNALLSTGKLPAGDTSATATATTAPVTSDTVSVIPGSVAAQPPPPPPPSAQTMDGTNPDVSMGPSAGGGTSGGGLTMPMGPATDVGGGGTVPAATASMFGGVSPMALAGVAVLGFLVLSRKKGR